ncbi:MAG TPA: hypothetical protein VJA21_17015 [Verrucomicrobiae bacterium]
MNGYERIVERIGKLLAWVGRRPARAWQRYKVAPRLGTPTVRRRIRQAVVRLLTRKRGFPDRLPLAEFL